MIKVDIKITGTANCSYGHKAEDCYIKKKADEARKKREEHGDQSNANAAKALISHNPAHSNSQHPACSNSQNPVRLSYSRATLCKADAKCWYMDSGTFDHMCSQLGQIRNLKPVSTNTSQSYTWRWLLSVWNCNWRGLTYQHSYLEECPLSPGTRLQSPIN